MNKYSVSEFVFTTFALIYTKIFFRSARLIRKPIYMRGKSSISYGKGFTTGHACRFDLPGKNIKTLIIGEHCQIGDNVHIVAHEQVIIGNNCLMASKIFISDTNHGVYSGFSQSNPEIPPNLRVLITKPVIIGDNVWIGENVCILPGVKIGKGCIIGAGSVVTKSFPDNYIIGGVPAKKIKYFDHVIKKWIVYEKE